MIKPKLLKQPSSPDNTFRAQLLAETKKEREHNIPDVQFKNFIKAVADEYQTSLTTALQGIYCVLQAGGTSTSPDSNVRLKIKGVVFESKQINKCLRAHIPDITPRQFAVDNATEIYGFAMRRNIVGNAYLFLKRKYPESVATDLKPGDQFWCSDFQIANPDAPEAVRKLLSQRYHEKFGERSTRKGNVKETPTSEVKETTSAGNKE